MRIKNHYLVDVFIWLGMILGYFLTRIYHLTALPIFTDEAIYIRWSQIGAADANWRFISLTDGKQPLFTWLMMIMLRILHTDPLFAGRLVSVFAGLTTLIGIWLVTYELFKNRRLSYITAILYLISPFTLFYDRMALYDSLVATLSIWNLYLAIRLVRTPRLDIALIFAMTLALAMLNKSSGFLGLYLAPLTLILIFKTELAKKHLIMKWILYLVISAILSQVYYSILRLSPYFHMISQKNNVFLFSYTEWMSEPFRFLVGNLHGLFDWLIHYLTYPIIIIALIPVLKIWKFPREKILLVLWWFVPFLGLATFGKVLYPRFILFMSLPLIILAGLSLNWFLSFRVKYISVICILGLVIIPVRTCYLIMTDIINAPIPDADRGQMMNDWPAGGGIKEVNAYLLRLAENQKIAVYTDGTFGLLPYAVEIYLVSNPNVEIHGIWPFPQTIPSEISVKSKVMKVFVITNQIQDKPNWPMELIGSYQKGTRIDRFLRLYKINSPISNQGTTPVL